MLHWCTGEEYPTLLFGRLALALYCKAKEGRIITQAFNKSRSKYSAVRTEHFIDLRLRKWRNVGHAHTGASDSHFIIHTTAGEKCASGTCLV